MSASGGTRAIIAALTANVGIAISKFVAYLLTGSSSMLAESIHSVADSGNQVLLLVGGRRAARRASDVHQFGYGRARYVYAFIVSIVLFTLGGLFALYEAWHKFAAPHPITSWQWVPVTVLLVAIGLEGRSFWVAIQEANHVRGKRSLMEFVKASRAPEIPVILLEDFGALVGLVFGLFGVSMTLVTGDGRWDAVGSAAIGVLLVIIAIFLAIEMYSMLIGESASPEHHRAIEEAIPGDGVERVIHMRTMHLGPDDVLVAAKVAVSAGATAEQIATAIDAAEERVRAAVPLKAQIYLEPDLYDAARAQTAAATEEATAPKEAAGH
ncbi:cation diffusion facilitator family transporter [Georgenia yuyongxinii]|uniref:Cation diffusion facilitator family transporter n=1 Tax=Georgenia yuyongxinii TaxID=2589797 RepID=A0A552WLM7_9MICO|nr:cation diffusion facilitator family transporter [Georgenia yuyongxinii]TRW43660.1 cation diffusion facilitator family transporter [Georgenia yuyongxinii]